MQQEKISFYVKCMNTCMFPATPAGVVPVTDRILDNGDLLIASASPSDTGLYTCNATNSQGTITAAAYLLVQRKSPVQHNVVRTYYAVLEVNH